jgi:hypothetical protein
MPGTLKSMLEVIAKKRVVFGHQSVGRDLLNAVGELARQHSVPIRIVETRTPESSEGIYHFRVGKNRDPHGKIADFLRTFEQIGAHQPDVALMKLCYVDFNRATNAASLGREYIDAIRMLAVKYRRTRFIAVTYPLTIVEAGPKAVLKKLVRRHPAGYLENAARQEFNDYLRKEVEPEQLFDIAAIEANAARTKPLIVNGGPVQTLPAHLTYDGGHLTQEGNRLMASSFINVIGTS